ncbi:hypothetical protein LuPra_03170 [Luteitalea pratensis]|uniref:3-keto-alpha-glucoside-1,2-lyase/3-keto-2-hydroxy-glucal hydratase domain-containing protein n=1 Tax=Luteitalea pratensis TaxID=1855912 RepID=A0A143PP53_LUTPR|nr:family 16 glycoside hydrolase [Luteitalea pratensis]AMY09943.1 hypothetical protein LuPra_03170 [Luteitalea pratensis]
MPRILSSTTPAVALNSAAPRLSRREALVLVSALPWLVPASASGAAAATSLFDGKSLGSWKPVAFGGEGEVSIVNGAIRLDRGNDLTAVVWTGKVPGPNFRVQMEANRVDGSDFFCAVTFPVAGSHCTFVVGGWGGTVVGFSSLDGLDASENETSHTMTFENGRWYQVAVDVTPTHIKGLIDGAVAAEANLARREVDVRIEMVLCRPLGLASWRTVSDIRNITLEERA